MKLRVAERLIVFCIAVMLVFCATVPLRAQTNAADITPQQIVDALAGLDDRLDALESAPAPPPVIVPPDPEPIPEKSIELQPGQSLQDGWDRLSDGWTLVVPAGDYRERLTIRDKTDATIYFRSQGGRRSRLIDQTVELSGKIQNVTIRGLAIVRPKRDPLDPAFDRDSVPTGGPGLIATKAGLRLWADGVTFLDCEFVGHTFGVSLIALDPKHDQFDGERVAELAFKRTIFRDIYNNDPNPKKFRSSGVFLERIESASFVDCAFVRVGYAEGIQHSKRINENQGIYHNTSSGTLEVANCVFDSVSFCPVQGRSDAPASLVGNVFLRSGGSAYVRQGEIDRFVVYRQQGIEDPPGSPTTTESVMSQDSKLANPQAVTISRGLIAEPIGVASWWKAVKVRTPTRISDVWAVGVKDAQFLANENESGVVALTRSGARSTYGELQNPGDYPGGTERFVADQVNRPAGQWNPAKHGAEPYLGFVGIPE